MTTQPDSSAHCENCGVSILDSASPLCTACAIKAMARDPEIQRELATIRDEETLKPTDAAAMMDDISELIETIEIGIGTEYIKHCDEAVDALHKLRIHLAKLEDANALLTAALKEGLEAIRDYDVAAHSKYGIENSDEQAISMHRMRKIARDTLSKLAANEPT